MKSLLIPALLAFFLAGFAFAQAGPEPAPPAGPSGAASASEPAAATPTPSAEQPEAATSTPSAEQPAATPTPNAASDNVPAPTAPSFLEQELEAAGAEISSPQVGTMTIGDIEKITAHLAIAIQKERYVQRLRNASFLLPGVGQFMAGDTLGGWLFIAWDVTVLTGTLVCAYFVLPSNVQFGSLDYLNSPLSSIKGAWESNTILSYLPLAGVLAGGMILETILRYASADNAARKAEKNIAEGKVAFKPSLELMDGGLGLGMRMIF
jgi:hypothetical protein